MIAVLILIGGGVGAVARWALTQLIGKTASGFPLATTMINIVGSFLLGLTVGIAESELPSGATPISIGVLGGFTTFSTWMVEADQADGPGATAAVLTLPAALGLMAALAGILLGRL